MNAPATQTAKTTHAPEDIAHQVDTLRAELMQLAARVSGDVSEGIESASRQIGRTGREARATATNAVIDHPLAAIGIAAAVGLVLGLVARKG